MEHVKFIPMDVTMYHAEKGLNIDNDLFYRFGLSPNGARVELLQGRHNTTEHVKLAKIWLKNNIDVVSITVVKESDKVVVYER